MKRKVLTCSSSREILRTVGKIITVTGRGFVLVQLVIHTFPICYTVQSQTDHFVMPASDQIDHLVTTTARDQIDHLVTTTASYQIDHFAMSASNEIVQAKFLVVVALGGGEEDGLTEIWFAATSLNFKRIPSRDFST
jgi:hypothetical protein